MMNHQMMKARVVGIKQTKRSLEKNEVDCVYLASDADPFLLNDIASLCEKFSVPVNREMSMQEIGKACGISVGASTCAILK